jgi:hypothetical protein
MQFEVHKRSQNGIYQKGKARGEEKRMLADT